MKLFKPKRIYLPTWQGWILLILVLVGFILTFFLNAHHFLATTNRVANADILVVEEWSMHVTADAAAREFKEGNYQHLFISKTLEYNNQDSSIQNIRRSSAANRMVSLGIPEDRIIECYFPATESHRSLAMARGVRDALRKSGIKSKGVNVMAPATHARKTWLVHRRALVTEAPAGIVAITPGSYDPARWWMNSQSAKWVMNNYAGLLYEWITGQ